MTATSVPVSAEQFAPLNNGIDLCYQTFGNPEDEPVLLVMGLGGPMIWWDPDLCAMLAAAGHYVIRYDNRDTGRSTKVRSHRMNRRTLVKAFLGQKVKAAYSLADMGDDAFELMDHLGLESAHIVGMSMGGMIVQTMALARPERVRSLTSIMSTTGRRSVGWQDPKLIPRLLQPAPRDKATYLARNAAFWELIGSPAYPALPGALVKRAEDTWERGINPPGTLRQMIAIMTQPDRTRALRSLRVPTLVIHGSNDRMVHVSGGRATAHAIPNAELLIIPGMGHDLPPDLFPHYVEAIHCATLRGCA